MKLVYRCIAFLSLALFSLPGASGITVDELARFLNVSSWKSVIDLPPESYSVELYPIELGEVGERILVSQPETTRHPEAGIMIAVGPQDGNYKIMITFGSAGSLSAVTKVPLFEQTLSQSLPDRLRAGDYVLFGQPRQGAKPADTSTIRGFAKGFLLRIKRKS